MRFIHLILALFLAMSPCTVGENAEVHGRYWDLKELDAHYIAQVARLRASGYTPMFGGDKAFKRYFNNEKRTHTVEGTGVFGPYRYELTDAEEGILYAKLRDAAPVWVDDGNVPMLIVVPEMCAPRLWQASRVKIDGVKTDAVRFPLTNVANAKGVATPKREPYLIFNVNRGAQTVHSSVRIVEGELADAVPERRGLTFVEGINLLLQYPDAAIAERNMDEDLREHPTFGQLTFLGSRYGSAMKEREDEQLVVFVVPRENAAHFARGYFTHVIRRDMHPNYTRFMFPSCDADPPLQPK